MGFDPVGTTGMLYALSVGSVIFLPALMTVQSGPDRVNPLTGYEEVPKEESKELIFGRLPKNHAHGSFLFMGGNGHAYNAVVKGYGAGLWDLWVDSAFDAKNKTQLALAPLPPLMVSIMVLNLAGLIPYLVPMTTMLLIIDPKNQIYIQFFFDCDPKSKLHQCVTQPYICSRSAIF